MLQQALIFGARAVVDVRQLCRAGRIALEQLGVVPLHDVELRQQLLRKGGPVLIAEEAREAFDRFHAVGQ